MKKMKKMNIETDLKDWSGKWHHYTDIKKLGVNPDQFHQDPAGIYFFPAEFKPIGSLWAKKKYLYTVEIADNAKILDIDNLSEREKIKFAKDLGVEVTEEDFRGEYFDNRSYWDSLKNKYILQKNAPGASRWTKDIRKLGYDAIFDDAKTLHVAEVQLLVLNPKIIKVLDVEERSGRSGIYKKIKDHQNLVAGHLEKWGKVEVKNPRTKKGMYGDPDRAIGEVRAEKGDAYLDWEISVEDHRMMRLSVPSASKRPSGYSLGALVDAYDKEDIQRTVESAIKYVSTTEASFKDVLKLTANEQSFQAIYLDPDAKDWKDRIVFHEPIYQDEMPGVIALKSLELENLIGLVVAAPLNVLRHFRELVHDSDHAKGWGQEDAATIIAKLVKAAKDLGAVIAYEQLGNEVPNVPPELIPEGESSEEDEPGDEAHFFDPLTKRRIVQKGPHYFDPSLVTLEDVEKKLARRSKQKAYQRNKPKNPGLNAYPENITDVGQRVWDETIPQHEKDIYKYQTPVERWKYANYVYETKCNELGISAYKSYPNTNPSDIIQKLKSSKEQAWDMMTAVLINLKKRGISRRKPSREVAFDVRQMGDNNFYLTTSRFLELDGLGTIHQVLDLLAKKHNFYLAKTRMSNGFKPINNMTKITVSESKKPQRIILYTTYIIPPKEAGILCNNEKSINIINSLMKLLNGWVKTGRLDRLVA